MSKVCIISTVHLALDNRIFYREACSLNKLGYQVTLIAVHDKAESINGIQIIPIKRLQRHLRPLLWLQVIKLAKHTAANVYHIHDPELLFIAIILRFVFRKPVIYDIHESVSDFIEIKDDIPKLIRIFLAWIFRWLEPTLAGLQSGLIFADDQIADAYTRINKPKVTLFNFPLDSFIDTAKSAPKNPDKNSPVILYLGGIKRNRGTALMLEAFSIVLKSIPTAKLFLVGPFAPESLCFEIQREIESRDINNSVIITGAIPFSDVCNVLSTASIGWIPFPPVKKYQKNIPTKLFEYMAFAIPVVSSDLKPVRNFIESERTGLLVKADDPTAHASAIIRILSNNEISEFLGNNGQSMVAKYYHWSDMEEHLINFYQQILTSNRK